MDRTIYYDCLHSLSTQYTDKAIIGLIETKTQKIKEVSNDRYEKMREKHLFTGGFKKMNNFLDVQFKKVEMAST